MKKILFFALPALLLAACSTETIKEKINKAGDVAGQTAGEFIEGASKGVQKAFDVEVQPAVMLKEKGLAFGKASIVSDSVGTDNLLLLYVIYNQDFEGTLTAKVFEAQDLEMGRARAAVSGKKGEAAFVEFHFDKRTDVDSKNKLTVE